MMLGFRLGRRLIAAVAVQGEEVAFHDCRFVSSRRDTLERAMREYFAKLLDQLSPVHIYYYAPTTIKGATDRLVNLLAEEAFARNIPIKPVGKAALFDGCALPVGAKRRHLREMVDGLWPILSEGPVDRQLAYAEALVAALVGECDV